MQNVTAQGISYSIHFPPGGREGIGTKALPITIDTTHYYTIIEIRDLAKPANGWSEFYKGVDTLVYPKKAKDQKLQTSLTVEYRIDATGVVDSVFIRYRETKGRWTKCLDCEKLILDYFSNTKWVPGKIEEVPVKTVDYSHVEFTIYDPNSKQQQSHFGY